MKTARFLLAALPLLFLAATSSLPRHQAFGPVRFGMPNAQANSVGSQFWKQKKVLTIADVRSLFVTSSNVRLSRNAAFESATEIYQTYEANPFLTQIRVITRGQKADTYNSNVRLAWEAFRDIGDAKFSKRATNGVFPPIDSVTAEKPEAVTDTWDFEGIHIELLVLYSPPLTTPSGFHRDYPVYSAVLRATEIAPPGK